MRSLYPQIEPYDRGTLDTGDGNLLAYQQYGVPDGKPVLCLHGGPGSGCGPGWPRNFDPARYRIICFDQRNAGESLPPASDYSTSLANNTTWHLVDDIELLRHRLGIDRWMLFGRSWGATLALVYAEEHPKRVTDILLAAVTTTTRQEIEWLYHGVRILVPEAWQNFRHGAPPWANDDDLVSAYRELLEDPSAEIRQQAADAWCAWEDAVMDMGRNMHGQGFFEDPPEFRYGWSRIVTHYFAHRAWLEPDHILRNAGKLSGIPGILIQGRLDLAGPPITAWELARAWPGAELIILPDTGHTSADDSMVDAIVSATDRLACTRH
ncbi:MAG: prolyl aminopeptidase [Thermomicrobiales bacterium]